MNMKNLISIILIAIALNAYSQDSLQHWKQFEKSTPLKTYIEQEVYKYLSFTPDTVNNSSTNTKIIIRDGLRAQKPLLIINRNHVENDIVLNHITLGEVSDIEIHKPSAKLSAIYGSLAQHGLIFVTVNKRKWKALRRKFL